MSFEYLENLKKLQDMDMENPLQLSFPDKPCFPQHTAVFYNLDSPNKLGYVGTFDNPGFKGSGTSTLRPHDCYLWNNLHYRSTPMYRATVCGTCDKIVGFRWRSLWDRLFSLFSSDPRGGVHHEKEI